MIQVTLDDLLALFEQIAGAGGGGGEGAPNEGTSSVGMGKRIDALETKIDDLKSLLETLTGGGGGGEGGAPGEAGAMPGGEDASMMPPLESMPPGLESALGGGGEMGAPMSPDMAAGQATPMVPGGGMVASASGGNGMEKRSKAFQVSELVSKLKKG
jgi:hypothetical protein